jgi:hypothetical protein
MQRLKEEYPNGLEPDSNWYKAFIAKAIVFRAVQAIVKHKRFPAYQANIVAYTVSCLAQRGGAQMDLDTIWSEQGISSELRDMFERWVVHIDHALRQTAEGRMPSEWAKRAECWKAISRIRLEIPDPVPHELAGAKETQHGEDIKVLEQIDRDSLICSIREIFNGRHTLDRDEVIGGLEDELEQEPGEASRNELDHVVRTALRRGILEHKGDGLALAARGIEDYERAFLKDQFLASMHGLGWNDRDASIRRFARWLGFRRTGPAIDDAARSIIKGLIRDDRLESNGTQMRRAG